MKKCFCAAVAVVALAAGAASGEGKPAASSASVTLTPLSSAGNASGPSSVAPSGEASSLTLREAIRLAAERNLDVRAELFNPALSEAQIRQNLGIYDPNLTLSLGHSGSDSLSTTNFASTSRQRSVNFDAAATQLLPWGGNVGLAFNNDWNSTNSMLGGGSYYDSTLLLSFTQPLLKNFGREATELNIMVARAGKEASLDQFRTKLEGTVAQVRTEYYRLYALRQDLEVKRTSLALATRILEENRGRVKAGVLPAMEIQNAEFGVALREKELIDAERAVRDEVDVIRNLIRLEGRGDIIPADQPVTDAVQVNVDDEVKRALANRPELKALQASLKAADIQARVARGRTLPDLSLTGNVGVGGVAGDYPKDLERLSSTHYPLWSIGVSLSYPLGNRAAENTYQASRLRTEQLKTQIRSQENAIENEVRASARAVAASYKQLEVTDRGRTYAEERLTSYIRKNQVGLATTKDVLDVENDLVTAKGNQIKARSDYTTALTLLWKATGVLLDKEGVRISEKDADDLLATR